MALTVLVGAGLGMVMPPTQVTVQLAAGREALGVATATISLSRAFGGAIGVAIVGATLFAQIDRSADGSSALLHQAIEGGSAYIRAMSASARSELVARVDELFRIVFLVIAAFTATGALIATTIPKLDWDDAKAASTREPVRPHAASHSGSGGPRGTAGTARSCRSPLETAERL